MTAAEMARLVGKTVREWRADNTLQLGAALAYYAVFATSPILVIAVAIASLLLGEEASRNQLAGDLDRALGPAAAEAVQATLHSSARTGLTASLLGTGMMLVSATALFAQLQQTLNAIWGVRGRADRGWLQAVKDRFWSFTAVLAGGIVLLLSVAVSTALSALAVLLPPDEVPGGTILWQALNWAASLLIITVLFAMIYKVLPDVKLAWRDVWVGAAATAFLFAIGKHLIGWYLANSSWVTAHGAAGSLVVLLLWVYYSSQIFLLGAEFTQVYANTYGRPLLAADRADFSADGPRRCAMPEQDDEGCLPVSEPSYRISPVNRELRSRTR